MSDPITSARLTLEPLRVDHAGEMLDVLSDPDLHTFDGGQVPSKADLDRRYAALVTGSGDARILNGDALATAFRHPRVSCVVVGGLIRLRIRRTSVPLLSA